MCFIHQGDSTSKTNNNYFEFDLIIRSCHFEQITIVAMIRLCYLKYSLLFLVITIPYVIIYRSYRNRIDIQYDYVTRSLNNVSVTRSDTDPIVNRNPRILCWIPTTLTRLDRAIAVYE
jgi:hypothetical protein